MILREEKEDRKFFCLSSRETAASFIKAHPINHSNQRQRAYITNPLPSSSKSTLN
jgi:hypothetical protein